MIFRENILQEPLRWSVSAKKPPKVLKKAKVKTERCLAAQSQAMQQTEMTLANTATSRSAKKRQRAQSRSKVKGDPVSGKTSLQLASVSKQCLSHYTRCWNSVKQKLVSSNGKLKSVSKVDEILSRELDRLYHNGEDISAGQYLIAAVVFFNNQLKSPAMQNLPHVKQSLKGWRKLAPQKSRLPIPWEVCCLLITHAVRQNLMGFALHMGLMFMLYLRPSEALRLRRGDVIPPVSRGQGGYKQWTVVLHPEELGVPSKTQEFDESLQLDLAYHHGFGEAIARFCENRKIAKRHVILTHTTAELLEFLETAQESLNLQAVNRIHPYRFRHGGASHDHVGKLRDLQAIQHRGRWQSQSSVRRYQKGGLTQVFGALPQEVQDAAIDAAANLVSTWQRVR